MRRRTSPTLVVFSSGSFDRLSLANLPRDHGERPRAAATGVASERGHTRRFWSVARFHRRSLDVPVRRLWTGGAYVACIHGPGGLVPIEELLFYALAPLAIVLVYACADELWLKLYNPPDDLINIKLIHVSPAWLVVAALLGVSWLIIWRINGTFPTYVAFLSGVGLLPTIFLYRTARQLMNWPAFAVTV